MIRNPRAILVLLTALNLLNYLDRFVLSAVLKPIQDDLQLSNLVGGSLATVFLVGFFATSPIFGALADRAGPTGRKKLIVLGVVVWSLATLASGFAHGPWSLLAARAVVGVGEASYVTIAPTIIDDVAPPKKKGTWLSIFYVTIPVGSALGYLVGGAVQHATHDWRQAFFVAGIPGLFLGAACLFLEAPSREDVRGGVSHAPAAVVSSARDLARRPLYRAIVLGQCAYTFAIGGFGFWAPKYLAARYGMEDGSAAFTFGLVTVVGGAVGTLVGGWLGDRVTRGLTDDAAIARASLAFCCAIATGVAAPLALIALGAPSARAFFAVILPCEIALFIPGGPFNLAVLRSVPSGLRASAMALSIFASHLFGDLWSPILIGFVADRTAMVWGMLLCPLGFAVAAIVWWRGRFAPSVAPND